MTVENKVYEFQDYKKYLNHLAKVRERGFKKFLSEVCECQTAYITHVLSGHAEFSLEQAYAISRALEHTNEESEYFLAIINFNRAGTEALRNYFKLKMRTLRESHLNIKNRLNVDGAFSPSDQAEYYSAWYYAAIHVMLTIPKFRNIDALSLALQLDPRIVKLSLAYLVSVGLAKKVGSEFQCGNNNIHLEKDSHLTMKYHSHWRVQALKAIERNSARDLHFSSVFTLSLEDAERIRSLLVEQIENCVRIIQKSPEQKASVLAIDFFDLV